MAKYSFFFHPQSRAQVVRWALHEVKADYEPILVNWEERPKSLSSYNPMGKLPTLVHHVRKHHHVITESAAICHYLAEAERSDLRPRQDEKASYFRWMFFIAGPAETAITANNLGITPNEKQQQALGFGTYERVVDTLDSWLTKHDFICGKRFTMADVYIGAQIMWGLMFKVIPDLPSFQNFSRRVSDRPAFTNPHSIDLNLFNNDPGRAKLLV